MPDDKEFRRFAERANEAELRRWISDEYEESLRDQGAYYEDYINRRRPYYAGILARRRLGIE